MTPRRSSIRPTPTTPPMRVGVGLEYQPMQVDSDEENEGSSEDKLMQQPPPQSAPAPTPPPIQTMPLQSNKKRTIEQRSPQKQLQESVIEGVSPPSQEARWQYLIAQGIKCFQEALRIVEGQNPIVETATRELVLQAQAVY
jgi:hypothetical protein